MNKDTQCKESEHEFVGINIAKYSVLACEKCGFIKPKDNETKPSKGAWTIKFK